MGARVKEEHQSGLAEQSVLRSIWNHRLLVVVCIGVFAWLGVFVTSTRPSEYEAEAGVVLEDPVATALSGIRPAKDEARYVADQVALFKSVAVSERASALARTGRSPKRIEPRDLRRKTSIQSTTDTNFVAIRFRARDPQTAAAGANAIVGAYREFIRADVQADAKAALRRLDVALAGVTRALSGDLKTEQARLAAIASQAAQVRRDLRNLISADLTTRLHQLETQLRGVLSSQQSQALALVREFRARRSRLEVNTQLAGDGVAQFSPAGLGKARGIPLTAALTVAIILGALVGTGLAYWLGSRKRAFSGLFEPQVLLGAPALAEIPDFAHEGISSKLPVLNVPGARSAEAFRLLASDIQLPRDSSRSERRIGTSGRSENGGAAHRSVAFVSASVGDGTTTLAANTALAAAEEGQRVLLLDADVDTHGLTRLLLGDDPKTIDARDVPAVGLNDNNGHATAESIRRVMETRAGGTLSLLEPGAATEQGNGVFRSEHILALDSIRDQFDLVVVDVPPILRVPYGDALLRNAEAVVVVVPHRSDAKRLKHVSDRFDLLGVRPIGYVYNFAPSRQYVGRR
jgi:Mrp family chromosome partitioning ATPase/capsular polysaccharide biosynthesis protein